MVTRQPKRFITMKNYKGIRKDACTDKFIVTKSINGKRCYETFNSIREASAWKNGFHPELKTDFKNNRKDGEPLNGRTTGKTFNDVWTLHFNQHIAGLELSSRETYTYLISLFAQEKETPINLFTPTYIDKVLTQLKSSAISSASKRSNFDRPLKLLKSMFRWYAENYDHTFISPILKRHFVVGKIKDIKKREMKLTDHDIVKFFSHLSDFYLDFAIVHFFIAGRVQEVAGIQKTSIDLTDKSLLIKDVVVWGRYDKKFAELKSHTKNGEIRFAHLTEKLCEIFKRRLQQIPKGCSYVFHNEGKPLSYRQIQFAYNKALRDAGLTQYSSTHILRHSMATITRRVTGSLEATQAVTGHKDQKLVQHYASLPALAQVNAVEQVEKHFENLKLIAGRANKCEQN